MKNLKDWESEVEKAIREAMEQGKLDNLKWQKAQSDFAEQVAALNRHIRDHNLKAPSPTLPRLPLRVNEEVRRIQEAQGATEEANAEQCLAEGVRQIVSARERTPRSPRWDAAWKRTLFRLNERLRRLRQGGQGNDAPLP